MRFQLITVLKIILFIVFNLSIMVVGQSQVPGYLGKRLSIDYSHETSVAITGVSQNNRGFGEKLSRLGIRDVDPSIVFNYRHNLNLAYVITRSKSIVIQVSQYYTGVVTEMFTNSIDNFSSDVHSHFHRLSVKSLGVSMKGFYKRRGGLAPLGEYYTIGLEKLWVDGDIVDRVVESEFSIFEIPEYTPSINMYGLSLGGGTNRIFADRFIFKIGVVFRYMFRPYFGFNQDYSFDTRFQQDFDFGAAQRLRQHNYTKLEIGFGILLF